MKGKTGFTVLLTSIAELYLEAIHDYIAGHDSPAKADHLLDQLLVVAEVCRSSPIAAVTLWSRLYLGILGYRQVTLKPYRLIYSLPSSQIIIHLIADGRRNMQTLLARWLLER